MLTLIEYRNEQGSIRRMYAEIIRRTETKLMVRGEYIRVIFPIDLDSIIKIGN